MNKEIMDLKELSIYLSFSPKKLYNLVNEDKIPYSRIGHQYRFITEDIDKWLKNQNTKKIDLSKKTDLSILDDMPETFKKRLLFAGLLTKKLSQYKIRPIVVGGNAVEFYTLGGYASEDIDIICSDSKKLNEILKGWEFQKKGRHWFNKKYGLLIESPSGSLVGSLEKISEVEIRGLKVYIIGIEDIIIDRLNAFVHWKSEEDGRWAKQLLFLNEDRIDWDYIEVQSKKEKTIDVLMKLKRLIKNEKI
ncbi:helix-turn-helix domain-containing protein [Candidatus Poribacteria bacterium]|nr:helix-turn-helix domain-containing protein [Candidatus Poribacteria bacterium]